jgi:hypothetical protein
VGQKEGKTWEHDEGPKGQEVGERSTADAPTHANWRAGKGAVLCVPEQAKLRATASCV